MRTRFHQSLDELKERLIGMGSLAEQAVEKAVEGYCSRDVKTCREVMKLETEINRIEREIDELALDLLAMQQPMAVDLRLITACMKINADLERVGDQAVNIAERGIEVAGLPDVDLKLDVKRMSQTVGTMIHRALESFLEGKAQVAEAVLKMDDIVDRMNDDTFVTMVERMSKEPAVTKQALDAILVSRNLERVADHATNIAEDVIFWVRGADVRHHAAMQQTGDS